MVALDIVLRNRNRLKGFNGLFHFLIVCQVAITTDRNYFTQIGRVGFQDACCKIFISGKDLPYLSVGLSDIGMVIGSNAISFNTQRIGNIERTVKMVFLRYDDNLIRSKDISCPVDTLIGRESGVIHEHILRWDPCLHSLQLHGLYFIIVLLSVIPAHE